MDSRNDCHSCRHYYDHPAIDSQLPAVKDRGQTVISSCGSLRTITTAENTYSSSWGSGTLLIGHLGGPPLAARDAATALLSIRYGGSSQKERLVFVASGIIW